MSRTLAADGNAILSLVADLTLLVDTASLTYRALFSVPDTVKAPDGTPVNAAYGFLGMLETLITRYDPDFLCCAMDEDWRPTWRARGRHNGLWHGIARNTGALLNRAIRAVLRPARRP